MGGWGSKSEPSNDRPLANTAAPTVASTPCLQEHPNIQHLVLAFFAGFLLALLLAFIFFIIKSYRKSPAAGHSSPGALDPPQSSHDPLAKFSSPEEALTYASVAFKSSEEKSDHLTKKHSAPLDAVVYAPVKVTDSSYLSKEA